MAEALGEGNRARRWGELPARVGDEDEARRRLVAAAGRCVVRRGTARVGMAEVADEAGVARSTLYRYFPSRDDVILALLLDRTDVGLHRVVRGLEHPDDAARSLPALILESLALIEGSEVSRALFSPGSVDAMLVEVTSEPYVDAVLRHFGPLFERWLADGELHADVDQRELVRWMGAVCVTLLSPPWRERSDAAQREFLDRYVVRALVPQ